MRNWGGKREGSGRKRLIPHVEGHCYCVECRIKRRDGKKRAGVGVDSALKRVGFEPRTEPIVLSDEVTEESLRQSRTRLTSSGSNPARQHQLTEPAAVALPGAHKARSKGPETERVLTREVRDDR